MTNEEFYPGETFEFEHEDVAYVATIEHDDMHGAPWEEEDGHGDVSEWTTRDKLPGELVLDEDGRHKRFYDFAGACKIARRDGWGFLPEPVRVERRAGGGFTGAALPTYRSGEFSVVSDCPNLAYSELHRMHRATMTARQYAAGAAMADYDRLRRWCADQWWSIGVVVRRAGDCKCCGETESLWGIESDAGEYVRDVATDLAEQLAERLSEAA
jgi:hypothetical protein